MPHGASLRQRRRVRRQRPESLALWIGAAWQKYTPNAPMLATMGDEVLPCRWWAEGALTTFPGLLVNSNGKRYSNENCTYGYMPYPQRVQPDGCAFLVWDDNWVRDSAPWQADRVGGEPRDTQEVYDAIAKAFRPEHRLDDHRRIRGI